MRRLSIFLMIIVFVLVYGEVTASKNDEKNPKNSDGTVVVTPISGRRVLQDRGHYYMEFADIYHPLFGPMNVARRVQATSRYFFLNRQHWINPTVDSLEIQAAISGGTPESIWNTIEERTTPEHYAWQNTQMTITNEILKNHFQMWGAENDYYYWGADCIYCPGSNTFTEPPCPSAENPDPAWLNKQLEITNGDLQRLFEYWGADRWQENIPLGESGSTYYDWGYDWTSCPPFCPGDNLFATPPPRPFIPNPDFKNPAIPASFPWIDDLDHPGFQKPNLDYDCQIYPKYIVPFRQVTHDDYLRACGGLDFGDAGANSTTNYPGGGIVELKGTFEFGFGGSLFINRGIELIGNNATITNGYHQINIKTENEDVIIRGIDSNNKLNLVNSETVVINIGAITSDDFPFQNKPCKNLTIKDVKIDGIIGGGDGIVAEPTLAEDLFWERVSYNNGTLPETLKPFQIENISITDCEIDFKEENFFEGLGGGIGINLGGIGTPDNEVNIEIENNKLRNCFRHSIFMGGIAGTGVVAGNDIKSGNLAADFDIGLNGIVTGTFGTLYTFEDLGEYQQYQPGWMHHFVYENNVIECGPNLGPHWWVRSVGLGLSGQSHSVVKNNQIKVEGSDMISAYDCIEVSGGSRHCFITDNVCSGSNHWDTIALLSAYDCVVKNNDLTAANPLFESIHLSGPQYRWDFETIGNLVIGNEISEGITCFGNDNHLVNNTFLEHPGWNVPNPEFEPWYNTTLTITNGYLKEVFQSWGAGNGYYDWCPGCFTSSPTPSAEDPSEKWINTQLTITNGYLANVFIGWGAPNYPTVGYASAYDWFPGCFTAPPPREILGFVLLLGENSSIVGCKNSTPPHGFDVCDQVLDFGTNNSVPGLERCDAPGADVVAQVEARKVEQRAKHEERKAIKYCKKFGGFWEPETKTCVPSEEILYQRPRSDRGRPPKRFLAPGQQ